MASRSLAHACDAPKANERARKQARAPAELIKRDFGLLIMLYPFASRTHASILQARAQPAQTIAAAESGKA
jgi:hypothetical protein